MPKPRVKPLRVFEVGPIVMFLSAIAVFTAAFESLPTLGQWQTYLIWVIAGALFTFAYATWRRGINPKIEFEILVESVACFFLQFLVQIPIVALLPSSISANSSAFAIFAPVSETFFFQGLLFGLIYTIAIYSGVPDNFTTFAVVSIISVAAFPLSHNWVYALTPAFVASFGAVCFVYNYFYWRRSKIDGKSRLDIPMLGHTWNNLVMLIIGH